MNKNSEKINVTKTFMPPIEEYEVYLKQIWESGYLTNQGPLLKEFETRVKGHLKLNDFQFVNNGTLALQIGLRALGITEGEIITTPFSYVATTSAILWERCEPVFVDIERNTLSIDASKIEMAITTKTKAIMAVHVFGIPCDTDAIEQIAKKHNLKVIYDAAHAFGVDYKGKSLLNYGDISTCSFHATKLFHTIEGGGVVSRTPEISHQVEYLKRFGHEGDEHLMLGTNAKASEFQAAMGLVNLKYADQNITERRRLTELYDSQLSGMFERPEIRKGTEYNYSYYPTIFKNEAELEAKVLALQQYDIFPRRYFYPSLNQLPYLERTNRCTVSEDVASRIICLPLYVGLEEQIVRKICEVLKV